MRKYIYAFALLILTIPAKAQFVQNGGFEDTVITANDTLPQYWSMDFYGTEINNDAHSGNRAVSIWNWYFYARAWVINGDAQGQMTGGGMPVSITPAVLDGWYKYDLGYNGGAPDSAVCEVFVFSHQGFSGFRDTVARARKLLGPAAEYTHFEVPINYTLPGMLPDTILIKFFSSDAGFCANVSDGTCLYLTLDDIQISSATGVSEQVHFAHEAMLFPSPSASGFKVQASDPGLFPCQLQLFDLSGKTVFQQFVPASGAEWYEPGLAPGLYLWKMSGRDGAIRQGKWSSR